MATQKRKGLVHTNMQLTFAIMSRLQYKVQQCITINTWRRSENNRVINVKNYQFITQYKDDIKVTPLTQMCKSSDVPLQDELPCRSIS